MDNIQNVISHLEAANPSMAGEVRRALNAMAAERDMANARAREAEARAHDLAVEHAKAKLEAQGQAVTYVAPEPQKIMLRSDFDKLDPRQQHDAIINQHIRIVD